MATDRFTSLQQPFPDDAISFAPKGTTKDKSKAHVFPFIETPYLVARMNAALGVDGWRMEPPQILPDGGAVVTIAIRAETGDWVTRSDVGYPDREGKAESAKDAITDGIRRCLRHFGVGDEMWLGTHWRDLWVPYDEQRKRVNISREMMIEQSKINGQPTPAGNSKPQAERVTLPADTIPTWQDVWLLDTFADYTVSGYKYDEGNKAHLYKLTHDGVTAIAFYQPSTAKSKATAEQNVGTKKLKGKVQSVKVGEKVWPRLTNVTYLDDTANCPPPLTADEAEAVLKGEA